MNEQSFEVLRDAVVKHLIEKNITITCMESCTSGLVASMITDTAGASAIFRGSLITYANDTKIGYDCSYDEEERATSCDFDSKFSLCTDESYDDKFDEFKVHSNECLMKTMIMINTLYI